MLERRLLGGEPSVVVRADIRLVQDVQPLGIGLHGAVLDAVVHHLHEVARTGRAAVQVALLGRGRFAGASRCPLGGLDTGSDGFQEWIEVLHLFGLAADHQAEAALEAEDAPRGADVHVVNSLGRNCSARTRSSW